MSVRANEKLIAKNTVFLYVRILISIALSLYTSRVVLEVLGVRDYGVYNVVGGLILILAFLNGTMSGTTQRFLNFEMGKGKEHRLSETFSAAWAIHIGIAVVVLILGESIGLWMVNNFLVIAPERMVAANWTYQMSLLGGIFTVLMVPFTGAVIAHEKMNIYAIFSLVFSILKLLIVLLLLFVAAFDNLIYYAVLMMLVSLVHFLCFLIYGLRYFPECSLAIKASSATIKTMLKYSGSDLIGTTCYTVENQGVLVILNRIGGTVLNAAGGLATTVALTINQFGSSLIMAFRPQIIKQFAAGNFAMMQRLMINCSKYAIILFALFAIPAFIEMDFVLDIWLKDVPPHTSEFCRLTLLSSMSFMTVTTLNCGMHATGKILKFSTITGITYLIELPLMYWLFSLTGNPDWVYILPIFQLTFNIGLIAVMLRNRMPSFRIIRFVALGFLLPCCISIVCSFATYFISFGIPEGWPKLISVIAISTALLAVSSWFIIFDQNMRHETLSTLKAKLHL